MHSLRTKFIIIICIISMICIGLTAGISYGLASSIMMDSSVTNENLTSQKAAQEIESWMAVKGEFLNTVKADLEINKTTSIVWRLIKTGSTYMGGHLLKMPI